MAPHRQLSATRADDGFRPQYGGRRQRGGQQLTLQSGGVHAATRALVALLLVVALAATTPAYAQVAGTVPAVIDIPSIGAHAPIVPLAQDETGAMQAPVDPDTVGWYYPGSGIGTPGNVLLDGHVDWGGRLRAFGWLKQLVPGDTLQLTDADGNLFTYTVLWSALYDADSAPVDQIFEQTSDEEVTLITCGGAFDQSAHMYLSRWVVRAMRSDLTAN